MMNQVHFFLGLKLHKGCNIAPNFSYSPWMFSLLAKRRKILGEHFHISRNWTRLWNLFNCFLFCRFLGSGDPNTFFSRAQRSRMVYEILATTPFGKEKKGEVGIERMVEEGAYSAAFPLHDVSNMSHIFQEKQHT